MPTVEAPVERPAESGDVGAGQTAEATTAEKTKETQVVKKRKRVYVELTKRQVPAAAKGKQVRQMEGDGDDDEDEEDEDELDSGSEFLEEDEPRKSARSQQRPKKRRRIVSSKMINSDGEEQLPEEAGWPTVLSRRTCDACALVGRECRFYKIQPRGRQQFACQWCKILKKACSDKLARQREVAEMLAARKLTQVSHIVLS